MVFYKAVILIAGPQKGTRFRPLSLDVAKPLFPVAGIPIVQHHIEGKLSIVDFAIEHSGGVKWCQAELESSEAELETSEAELEPSEADLE